MCDLALSNDRTDPYRTTSESNQSKNLKVNEVSQNHVTFLLTNKLLVDILEMC